MPDDLVSVSLKGTSVNRVPSDITILDSKPLEAMEKLEAVGAQRIEDMFPRVEYKGLIYTFKRPEAFRIKEKGSLSEGDVIYTFLLQSREEKSKLIQNCDLKKIGTLDLEIPNSPEIFLSEPNFYVILIAKYKYFTCSMHPSVRSESKKDCPRCGMELVEMEGYE